MWFALERFLRGPSRYAAEPAAVVSCAPSAITPSMAARLAHEIIAPLELDGEPRSEGNRLVIPCPRPDIAKVIVIGMNTILGAAADDRQLAGDSTIGAVLARWWSPLEAARLAVAARRRSIPVWWPQDDSSWLVLGLGRKSRWYQRCYFSEDPARDLTDDKLASAKVLQQAGLYRDVPVRVDGPQDAVRTAEEIGYPVVVKPNLGYAQIGVFLGLDGPDSVAEAARRAEAIVGPLGGGLLVERYFPGTYMRCTVVGGTLLAAIAAEPPWIKADGASTAESLVREGLGLSEGAAATQRDIAVIEAILVSQQLDPTSVPNAGSLIRVGHANHGVSRDVLPCLPAETKRVVEHAARLFPSPVLGIDLIVRDPAVPFDLGSDVILEVNSAPTFTFHEQVGASGRELADRVLDEVVAGDGRVPVVAGASRAELERLAEALRREELWPAGHTGGRSWSGDPTRTLGAHTEVCSLLRLDRRADCFFVEVGANDAEEGLIVDRIDFALGDTSTLLDPHGFAPRQDWSLDDLIKACRL